MKTQNAEELKIKSNFESIKAILAHSRFADRLDYHLAFWTLPSDRRLPLSLLDYPLRKVLNSTFDELARTPGIGQKKLSSLILLLERAAKDTPPSMPIRVDLDAEIPPVDAAEEFRPLDAEGRFEPALVSEALWQQWRDTVVLHELDDEKLGRLAPSLIELPTVIWDTPLSAYIPQSLHQIRHLRTHGEKRVRVVLEVFFVVHEMLRQAGRHARLALRLSPSFVPPLESWFEEVLSRSQTPTLDELRDKLVLPLIEQLELDVGAEVIELAKGRLGVDRPAVAVRQQSRELGVTRARIYQLLEECERVMAVRWPQGRRYFNELRTRLERDPQAQGTLTVFDSIHELFFPRRYEQVEAVLRHA
jgi:hypothetical protein